jgi:5-(carboxyamino)imidazole ribonucleotide synthase
VSAAAMANTLRSNAAAPLLPGARLGMLGAGQLGRMFALAAARMGYHVHVFSPRVDSPTGQVSHRETVADYHDEAALAAFAQSVDVVTLEWENIPASAIEIVEKYAPVRPGHDVLHITQHRLREKQFLTAAGISCAPFAEVNSLADLEAAIQAIGVPCVLKTAVAGYDGKGQIAIQGPHEAAAAWDFVGQQQSVLEGWINYQQELSVLVARSTNGEIATCGPIANDHANHILDVSRFSVAELAPTAAEAEEIGRTVAEQLGMVGLCCVELFLTKSGKLVVNEIAPRPHNSGHLTIEACVTSQFEQQVRAVCGLPLGSMRSHTPAAMVNLLGDLWNNGEPPWLELLSVPRGYLHLYGKTEAKPGRKMGHYTVLADDISLAVLLAEEARERLRT